MDESTLELALVVVGGFAVVRVVAEIVVRAAVVAAMVVIGGALL